MDIKHIKMSLNSKHLRYNVWSVVFKAYVVPKRHCEYYTIPMMNETTFIHLLYSKFE